MNNYERIKNMTIDELAEFISALTYCSDAACNEKDCFIRKIGYEKLCTLTSFYSSGAKQWLESEVEE